MHQTMFPLLILSVLEHHATKECPLTITEITNFVNQEFAAFAFEKEQLINRSTVMRILEAMELWTEGNLLDFHVVQCGTKGKKQFHLEKRIE